MERGKKGRTLQDILFPHFTTEKSNFFHVLIIRDVESFYLLRLYSKNVSFDGDTENWAEFEFDELFRKTSTRQLLRDLQFAT